jgi:hypothetical protein
VYQCVKVSCLLQTEKALLGDLAGFLDRFQATLGASTGIDIAGTAALCALAAKTGDVSHVHLFAAIPFIFRLSEKTSKHGGHPRLYASSCWGDSETDR